MSAMLDQRAADEYRGIASRAADLRAKAGNLVLKDRSRLAGVARLRQEAFELLAKCQAWALPPPLDLVEAMRFLLHIPRSRDGKRQITAEQWAGVVRRLAAQASEKPSINAIRGNPTTPNHVSHQKAKELLNDLGTRYVAGLVRRVLADPGAEARLATLASELGLDATDKRRRDFEAALAAHAPASPAQPAKPAGKR